MGVSAMKPVHAPCVRDAAGIDTDDASLVSCPWTVNADTTKNITAEAKVIRRTGFLLLHQQQALADHPH
jgi:hypothetical protein